jgi:NitT/TauT family transport system substrate-binding protein
MTKFLLTRRSVLTTLAATAVPAWAQAPAQKRAKLVLAGPPASVSNPLTRIVDSGALAAWADQVQFVPWTTPDQLRALTIDGAADFIATPSNVAANLYNRGVPLTLLNIGTWGNLWMVSRSPDKKTLADFKGEEIAMPFRSDMPDILFQLLAEKQGLNPQRDFRLRYVATPLEAMQQLVMRQVDHALLAEPAVSMALRKTQSFPGNVVAPTLYRSVDLQKEWGRVLQRPPLIPQAGIAALGEVRNDPALLAAFQSAYADAQQWCANQPDACGAAMAKHSKGLLLPEAVADGIRAAPKHLASARQARAELEFFYGLLLQRQPALVGGKLPDAAFYGGAA